ncbi:MAG: hypothetical protein KDK23_10535, partial [Leptospiraceae bacterium]|nr:hypothetical protein [Leptospiraceae bacterium]
MEAAVYEGQKALIGFPIIVKFPGLQNPFGFSIQSESRYMAVKKDIAGIAELAKAVCTRKPKKAAFAPPLFRELYHRMAVRTKSGLRCFPSAGGTLEWAVKIKEHAPTL